MKTTTKISTKLNDEQLKDVISAMFSAHGFKLKQYEGRTVWKKGSGWLTAPQVFQISKENDLVCIDSWISFPLLPGVYIGKSGLNSSYGFIVKVPMRNILKELVSEIMAPDTQPQGYFPKK